jgi:hypothetical protein
MKAGKDDDGGSVGRKNTVVKGKRKRTVRSEVVKGENIRHLPTVICQMRMRQIAVEKGDVSIIMKVNAENVIRTMIETKESVDTEMNRTSGGGDNNDFLTRELHFTTSPCDGASGGKHDSYQVKMNCTLYYIFFISRRREELPCQFLWFPIAYFYINEFLKTGGWIIEGSKKNGPERILCPARGVNKNS